MNIISIILLTFLKTGASLKCYQCNAKSKLECEKAQVYEDCPNEEKNPVCVTISYSEVLNEGERLVNPLIKKCSTIATIANQNSCREEHCVPFWKDCKAHCCTTDGCNNDDAASDPTVIQKKRRTTETNSASSTMYMESILLITAVLLAISFHH